MLAAALVAISLPAFASPAHQPPNWHQYVEILDTAQQAIKPAPVGQWYPVSLIQEGSPYSLRIHNPLDERIRVLVSIDGVNPFTGRRAMMADAGVVIGPGESKTIAPNIPPNRLPQPAMVSPAKGHVSKINVAFFREVRSRPVVAAHMKLPPASTHPTKWVPPEGTRFYSRTKDPESIVYHQVGPAAPKNPRWN